VRERSPQDRCHEEHPRDVAGLGEEPSRVVRLLDDLVVGFMSHQGITWTCSPSETSVAPRTTTLSPEPRPPVTRMRFPSGSPSCTSLACTTCLPPSSVTTKTAKPFGSFDERITDASGTTVAGADAAPSGTFNAATMPALSCWFGFGIVVSTSNTRLFGSAEGETRVM